MTGMILPLSRRPRTERRVITIIRGGHHALISDEMARCFERLRRLAADNDLIISPPGTPYIIASELMLISWLASAQRVVPARPMPDNLCLKAIVRRCAQILSDMRLRLSSLTLYSGRLHSMAD